MTGGVASLTALGEKWDFTNRKRENLSHRTDTPPFNTSDKLITGPCKFMELPVQFQMRFKHFSAARYICDRSVSHIQVLI